MTDEDKKQHIESLEKRIALLEKGKKIKDPNKPKRPLNKWAQYVKDNSSKCKEENPHLSQPEILKQLAKEFKEQK